MDVFYQDNMDLGLRFGDVLKGFIFTEPEINEPILTSDNVKYSIDIAIPYFSVVLTPCCSIENKTISLTPLIRLRKDIFNNPYFADEPTKINRMFLPKDAILPQIWEKLSEEEKLKAVEKGLDYAFYNLFVYKEHPYFQKYSIRIKGGREFETNYYMIDFSNIYTLKCDIIKRGMQTPTNVKYLQLSICTRGELRQKISYYYLRKPDEDED